MGFPAASRELHRMLQVQHLVVQHVSHNIFGNGFAVQLAVQNDLAQRRIEAAQQRSPSSLAPTQPRQRKQILEVLLIQAGKQWSEIVMRSGGQVVHTAGTVLPQAVQSKSRGSRIGKSPVNLEHVLRRLTPVQAPEQNRCRRFHYRSRSVMQCV